MYLNKIKLSNFLFCFALFISFFPHTTFGIFNLKGSQISLIFPSFFFIFLIFSFDKIRFNFLILFIFISSILALVINFYFTNEIYISLVLRTITNYFFFFIFLACFNTYYYPNEEIIKKIIFSANFIWLIWGVVQLLDISSANFAFTNRSEHNKLVESRGLNSLATEASYFGMILILFNLFYLFKRKLLYSYLSKLELGYLIFNFVFIFFVVKSATTSILAMVIIILVFLKNLRLTSLKKILKFLFFIFATVIILSFFEIDDSKNRGISYIYAFFNLEDLKSLFYYDLSFNERTENFIAPIIGFLINSGMPGGFNGYVHISDEIRQIFFDLTNLRFIAPIYIENINSFKIISFFGDFIFQQGLIGVMIILVISNKILKKNSLIDSTIILIIIFIICTSPQMTYSFLPLLLFITMYDNKKINN
jgi:hypothetical protein